MLHILRLFRTSLGVLRQPEVLPEVAPTAGNSVAVEDDPLRAFGQAVLKLIFSVLLGYAISCLVGQARGPKPKTRPRSTLKTRSRSTLKTRSRSTLKTRPRSNLKTRSRRTLKTRPRSTWKTRPRSTWKTRPRSTSKRSAPSSNASPPFSPDMTSSLCVPSDPSSSSPFPPSTSSSGVLRDSLTDVPPLFSIINFPPLPPLLSSLPSLLSSLPSLLSPTVSSLSTYPLSLSCGPLRDYEPGWIMDLKRLPIDFIPFEELTPCFGEVLGSGAYGTVIALCGKFSGCCLKMFTPMFQGHREFVEEVALMHRLAHLKIPRLKGVCLNPKGIIMSRHQSTLLRWILVKEPRPADALDVLVQLCHIVKDLHAEGLCHNDLKANNVMVDQTENGVEVILIDFGLTGRIGDRPFFLGRSLTFGEQMGLLMSQEYRSFYAPRLYVGGKCSPSTDAYALAYIAMWVLNHLKFAAPCRLRRLLKEYLGSCGDNCSVDAILQEVQSVLDEVREKKPKH